MSKVCLTLGRQRSTIPIISPNPSAFLLYLKIRFFPDGMLFSTAVQQDAFLFPDVSKCVIDKCYIIRKL